MTASRRYFAATLARVSRLQFLPAKDFKFSHWQPQVKQLQIIPKKKIRNFNEIRIHGLCVSTAVFCQLSYEDPLLGVGQFVEFISTRERNET